MMDATEAWGCGNAVGRCLFLWNGLAEALSFDVIIQDFADGKRVTMIAHVCRSTNKCPSQEGNVTF